MSRRGEAGGRVLHPVCFETLRFRDAFSSLHVIQLGSSPQSAPSQIFKCFDEGGPLVD